MGLMDREYMHRTPEVREAEYHQKRSKKQLSEDQKHKERQLEMYRLMAKGNSMTRSDKRRLEQINEENRVYMARTATYSDYSSYEIKGSSTSSSSKQKKSSIVPVVIFTLVVIGFIFLLVNCPDLANFDIWEFIGH